jgi:hypothetical protein
MPEKPWWYLKQRLGRPNWVMGRPRSSVPLAERRRLAREKYRARLATQGLCLVRIYLSTAVAEQLRSCARENKLSLGAFVASLLKTGGV